ncbi:alpha/beta hydrolase [filamentous cyanobacterium CCP1]|nr:alpha/beta hydrolase [filamentous cyanobacterium CCP2]PSB60581.1 alpha/beta hydrolase [filamentous cyanobacterium CCP1]
MVKTIDILGFPHAYELSAPTDSPTVLVFLHGWLLSRSYWRPVIQQLAPDYQCLSYDLRGFGASQPILEAGVKDGTLRPDSVRERATVGVVSMTSVSAYRQPVEASSTSDAASPSYTPAAYAHDLGLLLKQLNVSKAWLVGHSLGGSIALWAAHQFPELVAGAICVNSGGGIYLKEEFERFRAAGQQLIKYRPRWLSYIPLLDMALTRMNVAQPLPREWGRQRLLDLLTALPEAAIGSLLDSTTEVEVNCLPQVVSQIQQPVHFIAGANDTIMEPKYVHHLASFHPSFECCGRNVSEIPNCGHLAMVEQPDAVVAEVRSVLARYEGSGE